MAAGADGLLPHLVQATVRFGLRHLTITEPSLETVFIQLTGRDLRDSSVYHRSGLSGIGRQCFACECPSFLKAFLGLFLRDLRVLMRELVPFCCAWGCSLCSSFCVYLHPSPHGRRIRWPLAAGGLGTIILPGLMAVAIMFSGIAAVALPLSSEFGITREIDDRVMCPLPLWAVALEKVCFSAMQSIIAALLVIPMAYYIPAEPVRADIAQLVSARAGTRTRQPACRIAGPGDRLHGQSQADRTGLFHHRCSDYLFGMRLLYMGRA